MICFRCGGEVSDGLPQCPNCGQRFSGARKTFTATTTSFRALESRRLRIAKEANAQAFAVGDLVADRYTIREMLEKGPLGTVYKVYDQEIELHMALKVIHSALLPNASARSAFAGGICQVRKLSQQHIVRVYEAGEQEERCFFTMQLLEGLTLRKVIGLRQERAQRFTVSEVEPIFNQLTMALGHAHRHCVHGDLKPENIIILPDVLKVTDFGAFEYLPRELFLKAQKGSPYLAPELSSSEVIDQRADIFSLGTLLYELLSGQSFNLEAKPISLLLDQPQTLGPVDEIIARSTAAQPEDRYESVEAFSEALGTYIDAQELMSVEQRSKEPLLPEDVTRKFVLPDRLRDPSSAPPEKEAPETESSKPPVPPLPGISRLPLPPPLEKPLPVVEAEESFVEELSGDELDALIEASEQLPKSIEQRMVLPPPELDLPPSVDFSTSALVAPTEISMEAVQPRKEPWFLRTNIGFVSSIMLVVGVVAFSALHFLDSEPEQPRRAVHEVVLKGDAQPRETKLISPRTEDQDGSINSLKDQENATQPISASKGATHADKETLVPELTEVRPPEPPKIKIPKPEPPKPEPPKPEPPKPKPPKP